MKPARRMPPRTRLFIMCAVVLAMVPIMLMANRRDEGPAATFLDSVAEGLRHEPRVEVLHVDQQAGQIAVLNKVTNQKLIFVLSPSAGPTAPTAAGAEDWRFTWKDESGKEIAKGRLFGSRNKSVSVMVPGLN